MLIRKKCRGDAINRLHNGQLLRQRRSEHWWLFASEYALVLTKPKWTNSFSKHLRAAEETKKFYPFRFGFPKKIFLQ